MRLKRNKNAGEGLTDAVCLKNFGDWGDVPRRGEAQVRLRRTELREGTLVGEGWLDACASKKKDLVGVEYLFYKAKSNYRQSLSAVREEWSRACVFERPGRELGAVGGEGAGFQCASVFRLGRRAGCA